MKVAARPHMLWYSYFTTQYDGSTSAIATFHRRQEVAGDDVATAQLLQLYRCNGRTRRCSRSCSNIAAKSPYCSLPDGGKRARTVHSAARKRFRTSVFAVAPARGPQDFPGLGAVDFFRQCFFRSTHSTRHRSHPSKYNPGDRTC